MKRLFIIGNGFDISHKLKTRYSDFQSYLKKNYPNASFNNIWIPEPTMMPRGYMLYHHDEVVGFLLKIISEAECEGNAWSDLENTLGKLDFDDFFDNLDEIEDDNEWHTVHRNEEIASNIRAVVIKIKEYFSDWVNRIDISSAKPIMAFKNLINNNDLFLTFNYTMTLEQLYNAKNVFHIHGKQGVELIFGHGNYENYYEDYMLRHIGSEVHLAQLQHELKKDTSKVIQQNKDIFKKLGLVDKIYSYGFSFSEVDLVYIKEICNLSLTENITWYLNDFDSSKFEDFKDKIKKCGFKGKFDSFPLT